MITFFRFIRTVFFGILLASILFLLIAFYYMEYRLPNTDELKNVQLQVPLQIYTRDNKLLATFGEKRRIPIPFEEIPKPLINAVLATEDRRYFQHAGVDVPGLARAAVALLVTGKKSQGGSTITMQVARSFYLTRHKTFTRKLREILLAIKIERSLSKQKILELYLNKIFLGNRAYGVGAAAEIYYGQHLKDLSLSQYAMLAGLPQAPSALNPLANPEAAKKRRDLVLTRMVEQHYINQEQYEAGLKEPLNASRHDLQTELKAPFIAELVREQLLKMYGDSIYTDGFRVYTTIDSRMQEASVDAIRDQVLAYDQRHGYRGPERNWGNPSLENMEAWEISLGKRRTLNSLEPAVVIETTSQTVSVLRATGDLTIIPWKGLSWARRQINADFLGPLPKTSQDILQPGDVIRIRRVGQGYQLAQLPKVEGGLVSINSQNGAILAMMGGFDFQLSNFNRITNAYRQPGSSFKPFIYSAALDKGFTLSSIINDAPIVIENRDGTLWRPQNSNHRFYGPTRLRDALVHSRNLASIRLFNLISPSYGVKFIEKFGFARSQLPPELSLALGTALVSPLQMAQGYAVFANGGFRITPFIIENIKNAQNQVIYQAKPLTACSNCDPTNKTIAPRAISPQNAFLITSVLRDVIVNGTAKLALSLNRADLAGKTGTTNDQVDAWFAGYNSDITSVAWLGFDQPQSLHEYGAQAALPIWMQFMHFALKGQPLHTQAQPAGIVNARINPSTGRRANANDTSAIFESYMVPYGPGNQRSEADEDGNDSIDDSDNADGNELESVY